MSGKEKEMRDDLSLCPITRTGAGTTRW